MKEEDTGMINIRDLFKSNELYHILIGNSRDAIFFAENSLVVDCNEAAVLMFGVTSKEELIGKFPFDFSPELQPDGTISKEKARLLLSESHHKLPQNFCWKYAKSDGSLFDALVSLNYFEHENHLVLHFSITEPASEKDTIKIGRVELSKEQTEDPLKLSHSLLQAALDSTADGILAVDLRGRITSFNKQFKATFDISDNTLESRDDAAVMNSVLDKIKDPAQFVSKVQYICDHPGVKSFDRIDLNDGRIIERYSFPQQINGQPIGRVWSFRDVTERIKTEEQLYLMAHV